MRRSPSSAENTSQSSVTGPTTGWSTVLGPATRGGSAKSSHQAAKSGLIARSSATSAASPASSG